VSANPVSYWTLFAKDAAQSASPVYARIAQGIGGDEELIAIAAKARPGQPYANMILAAVHYLLLRGAEHRLRSFYPNLGGTLSVQGEDPFPLFKDFVLLHRSKIEPLVATRVTNTNEVGRSAILHAGFRAVAAQAGEPLHLIEVGPSAGLNMLWDKYGVRYRRGDHGFETQPQGLDLVIDCELRGDTLPPLGPPPVIASRVGLELNPVDLSDPSQRDWLKALVWPEHVTRFARLEKALEIHGRERPRILAGSALDLLPDVLAGIGDDVPVCVYHTFVTYQFSHEMREALDNLLIVAGLRRPIWRLAVEGILGGETPVYAYRYHDGNRDERLLARTHSWGAWLEWLA
jgi:hypothetical protein